MDPSEEIARLRQKLKDAERLLHEEQARANEQQARAEEATRLRQNTTLTEYLDGCHEMFMQFSVQEDAKLTTKGGTTDPSGKRCPTNLVPWADFLKLQQKALGRVHSHYPKDSRDFESWDFLSTFGVRIHKRPIANEKMLEGFEKHAVEEPVSLIIEYLSQNEDLAQHYPLGRGVIFENHYNPLSDNAEEPVARRQLKAKQAMLPDTPSGLPEADRLRVDQICVFRVNDEGHRRLAFVVEYKPPHKLTMQHLRLGLRTMNVFDEVVNRATKPSEPGDELFEYHADQLVSAAVAQTYHYMIEAGLEYGYLTTGDGIVFLYINWEDVTTLHYHLAEPKEEAMVHGENARHCTAVSQVLAFTLMSMSAPRHGQTDRAKAWSEVKEWEKDFASTLANIPVSERKQTPPQSAYNPRTYKAVERSPYLFRKRIGQLGSCSPDIQSDIGSDDDENDDEAPNDTPIRPKHGVPPRNAVLPVARKAPSSAAPPGQGKGGSRQYCTQKCLLGLVRGGRLDAHCPNVSFHRDCCHSASNGYHPVDHETWLRLLHAQLNADLDHDIQPLNRQGARGAVFKVTLTAYGYTFLAKGTVPVFVEDLHHEAAVYDRLRDIQGICVPVFLGAVDLEFPYFYDLGVRIGHMVFLSWAGIDLDEDRAPEVQRNQLNEEVVRSLRAVHMAGVLQADVRAPNMLWNAELGRVFVIDFERSQLLDERYMAQLLQGPAPKKQRLSRVVPTAVPSKTLAWMQSEMRSELLQASRVFFC